MKDFVYDEQDGLLGEVIDGQFVPLSPAPTDEALDDLIDDVCNRIEWHPHCGKNGKMHRDLKPPRKGRYSLSLMYGLGEYMTDFDDKPLIGKSYFGGGVHAWITQGTLRNASSINNILSDYADAKDTLVRRRKINDWTFDKMSLWEIGMKFGLPGPPPPPTAEQIAARDRVKAEQERGFAESRARVNQMMQEVELDHRKKRLLNTLTNKFYTLDYLTDADCAGETMPQEYHDTAKWRSTFKKYSRDLVDSFVDAGLSDEEVIEKMTDTYTVGLNQGSFRATVAEDLKPGEKRHYIWPKELRALMTRLDNDGVFEKYDSDIRLLADGRFAYTLMPKEGQ